MTTRIKPLIGWLVSLLGALGIILALAADFFNLDQDSGWGPARRFLLFTALVMLVLPHLGKLVRAAVSALPGVLQYRLRTWFQRAGGVGDRVSTERQNGKRAHAGAGSNSKIIWTILLSLFIASGLMLTWLISVGRWTHWPGTTSYYHLLAEGFRAGSTHLQVKPPLDLLALPNPYDPAAREGMTYLWDVSLYRGQYYLYWGPAPTIACLLLEPLLGRPITDGEIVWGISLMLVAVNLGMLGSLWNDVFGRLRWCTVIPAGIVVAFSNPLPWLMGRPAVYEAAIVSGQLCLMAGVIFVYPLLTGRPLGNRRYFLAGLAWGLAAASRITLIPGVAFLAGAVLVLTRRVKNNPPARKRAGFRSFTWLLMPLLMALALMGAYNLDRFGSPFELGHRFQLGRWDKSSAYESVIAGQNMPMNLFNYSLNPYRWLPTFPFIKPTWGDYAIPALHVTALQNYHTEQVSGVILVVPFCLFALLPIAAALRRIWYNLDRPASEWQTLVLPAIGEGGGTFYIVLSIAFLLVVGPLLVMSVNSMRHEMDFMPLLLMVSSAGFGYALSRFSRSRLGAGMLLCAGLLLACYTAWASVMLGITGYNAQFEKLNPVLFDSLTRFFTR